MSAETSPANNTSENTRHRMRIHMDSEYTSLPSFVFLRAKANIHR